MSEYQHGTSSAYSYHGCRCEDCQSWKREYDRRYYEKNREKVKARNRDYYHRTREERLKKDREYREKNKERLAEYAKQYVEENREHVNAKNRRWRQANPWKAWFYNWKDRERKRGEVYDDETLEWIKNLDSPPCTYCPATAETMDHIVPRTSGGTNDRDNLTPSCHRCNRRKSSMPVQEFLKRLQEEGH